MLLLVLGNPWALGPFHRFMWIIRPQPQFASGRKTGWPGAGGGHESVGRAGPGRDAPVTSRDRIGIRNVLCDENLLLGRISHAPDGRERKREPMVVVVAASQS